tara:strand:- start:16 stop:255 length:240 start_codon:yes stop_codon:yes gene_type:complete
MICKYKNILGKPNDGIHKFRIFNIAIVDVILTILLAFIINKFIPKYKFFYILLLLFILGIILHRIFCVKTTIDKFLFEN